MIAHALTSTDPWDGEGWTTSTGMADYSSPQRGNGQGVAYIYPDQFYIREELPFDFYDMSKEELIKWIQLYIQRWNRTHWRSIRKEIKKIIVKKKVVINYVVLNLRMMFSKSGYLPSRIRDKVKENGNG